MDAIQSKQNKDVKILTISGRIAQEDSIALEEALDKALQKGDIKIVLDLTRVKHICSTALGVIVSVKRKLKRQNGDIKLAVKDGEVKNLLQLTMLDRVFELFENQESAVQASEN
ncbi:MAG: STAS domain-containing protein [Spirochaetales bacterium]|nr:STAS domain-containing protein [Spirochaetales bacterium]